ncbi:Galactose/methyl galactoside import ATP-binding protein MglA [Limihaloglobus sulfuriphilus]|uniref:Galactose/methyl galactoside import ATP-binding protein MglA n=1 Tax=Limihaloglobus sulfuriphilus TaxID=1851148 RepID=A0A1R7T695_9BACT|nr:sugar ABC transporter ATP-binding protein [Limihaloglobus sulfuriphilus]AQQ72543.1 Galactose/methyl galactoside import ATP-binding protein MglA [Limihaloglobus sulfuriphilus]
MTESKQNRSVLSMAGISKSFGPVRALSDVNFVVRKGTVHALVGENGAGKSTLMKVLAGVHRPDSGTIRIQGREQTFNGPHDALKAGVSMIYQELDLAEDLSVAENVYLGGELKKGFMLNQALMNERTDALAAEYGFNISSGAQVSGLSTGDCQIVELLKALHRNANVIVMDEPTSSLSKTEASKLFEIVRNLRRGGISIIYISHRLEEVIDLADDITVLRDGSVVHTGKMQDMDIPRIVHHMVGRELKDFYPARDVSPGRVCVEAKHITAVGVKDVSFKIKSGEIVGVAGLVGAGRTELAEALFGVREKTGGTLAIDGREVKINSPAQAISAGIALLTEDRKRTGLCVGLACSWNVTLPNLEKIGMKHFISPAREDKAVIDIASKVSVKWPSPSAPADSLSGGNQQKLLIARWLMADSRFVIFDEPTRGIDVGAKKEVYKILNTLAAQGKAILMISSELPELFGVADRILVIRGSEQAADLVTAETSPDEVMKYAATAES